MTDKKLGNLADLLGTVVAVSLIIITLDFIEGDGTIWLPLYTLGVVIITNKINRIVRSKD
jgi:hypothetical protein